MTWREALLIVVSAILGGSGIVGIAVYYIRRYVDKKLDAEEKKAAERRQFLLRKAKCEEEMQHALGRWIFWVNRWIETGNHNGELREAYDEYQKAEKDKKELERDIIAQYEQKKN